MVKSAESSKTHEHKPLQKSKSSQTVFDHGRRVGHEAPARSGTFKPETQSPEGLETANVNKAVKPHKLASEILRSWDRDGHLPEDYSRLIELLSDALGDENHELRPVAEQALRRFAVAMVKDKGVMIQEASQKYKIPPQTISDWADMGLIPVLYKGKKGVYLDEEAFTVAAPLYHEAKRKGAQPARFIKGALALQEAQHNQAQSH
jgi:hypothetical protein